MNIIEDIVSNGHGPLNASYIVIHETANPGATARNHRDYWSREDDYAVHYVADWTGDVYHCVPDSRLCWQVGNGNAYVVGIELCHATNQSDFEKVWQVGVEWAAWALKQRGWGTDRLISHNDCTNWWGGSDHTDPIGYFQEYGKSWEQFKSEVAKAADRKDWPVQLYQSNGTNAQKWKVTKDKDGYLTFTCVSNGKCLDVKGCGKIAGTGVQSYVPNNTLAQKWKLIKATKTKEGWAYDPPEFAPYEIAPACAPTLRLDAKGAASSNGTELQIYTRNQTTAQLWYLIDNSDGTYSIMNDSKGAKAFVDVVGGGK